MKITKITPCFFIVFILSIIFWNVLILNNQNSLTIKAVNSNENQGVKNQYNLRNIGFSSIFILVSFISIISISILVTHLIARLLKKKKSSFVDKSMGRDSLVSRNE